MVHRPPARRCRFLVPAGLCLAGCATAPTTTMPETVSALLDQAVLQAIAEEQIRGAVLCVGCGEHILLEKAYGDRRILPARDPMTLDTIFDLASLTKAAGTATALALLLEDGKISLDDPVSRFLPAWPEKELTVRELATHTSGFQAYLNADGVARAWPALTGPEAVFEAIARHERRYPRAHGSTYSCLNYLLLARVAEAAAGEDLEDFLRERVWHPLGMDDTGYRLPADKRHRCAPTEGDLQGVVHDPLARLYGTGEHLPGNAGLFSTGPDLARFMAMLASKGTWNGRAILKPSTVELLFENQAPATSGAARGIAWVINEDAEFLPRPGHRTVRSHAGFTGTFLLIDLESRAFFVLLASRLHPDGKGDVAPLRKRVAQIIGAEVTREGSCLKPLLP
jgi:CubicO group peptidase (beta-lactamase class C family)